MHKLFRCCQMLGVATVAAWGLGASAMPAVAGSIYEWRTESGTYAFSDSIENVPARYRDQVTTRAASPLATYARLTPVDGSATSRYERDIAARLDALRSRSTVRMAALHRAAESAPAENAVSLRIGAERSPSIQLTPTAGGEPIVVETIPTRSSEGIATRHSVVVKQGERILAITKPRARAWNPVSDTLLEESIQ